jgi:1,4-dihydroxy-2-naphthoyl-CoA hydrolase
MFHAAIIRGLGMDEKYNVGLVKHLGMRLVEVTPGRVVGELEIRDELRTLGVAVHGGTLMALADTVGAMGTVASLAPGQSTSTIESKTNFFAAGREGTVRAIATPLHKGRRTQVWQTRVTDASGKLLSLTIQTQIVVEAQPAKEPS